MIDTEYYVPIEHIFTNVYYGEDHFILKLQEGKSKGYSKIPAFLIYDTMYYKLATPEIVKPNIHYASFWDKDFVKKELIKRAFIFSRFNRLSVYKRKFFCLLQIIVQDESSQNTRSVLVG